MAIQDVLGIIFGKRQAEIGGIVLDASIRETHKAPSKVTENPVEEGAKVTDHVQIDPITLTIEGMISDSPLGLPVIGNIQNFISTAASFFGKASRSVDAYERFLKLREDREPFDVITGLKRYENMILEDFQVDRDRQKANAIYFIATLKQIRIVASETTDVAPASDEAKDRAAKIKDAGQKKAEEVSADDPLNKNPNISSQNSDPSILFDVFGKVDF